MFEPNTELYKYILSVDIGIKNLGLILLETEQDYTLRDIIWFELIDITRHPHLDNDRSCCQLDHSRTISDWLSHVFFLHKELFDLAEVILVENQPLQGHKAVEQLIFHQFRSKVKLIHPRRVHSFMGWSHTLTYEQRKEKSIQVLQYRLGKTKRDWLIPQFERLSRKHDISDAFIQALFYLDREYKSFRNASSYKCLNYLDCYRFRPWVQ